MKITASTGIYESAADYLRHHYDVPTVLPELPLADEPFVALWRETSGKAVLDFLAEEFGLPAFDFDWERTGSLRISFADTLGGRLPVIMTGDHQDFCNLDALLNARQEAQEIPLTVNAFTMQTRAAGVSRHRVLLLNRAPYSNIPAEVLGLSGEDWLALSHRLRQRHECAHYETLRLFGSMRNHALDEILADALGQIAVFGNFDANRQRVFFGLTRGRSTCTGRLSFYCRGLKEADRPLIYQSVDALLDAIADELNALLAQKADDITLLTALAGTSLARRLELLD